MPPPPSTRLTPCARAHDATRTQGTEGWEQGREEERLEESGSAARELARGRASARDREVARFVCEAAILEHVLGTVVAPGGGLDAEAGEHCVRLPAAEELDGELVDISAEEGGSAAGAEAAGTDPVGVDARGILKFGCGVSKSVGDVFSGDVSWAGDSITDSACGRVMGS